MALEFKYFDVDQPSRDRATIQLWDGDDLLGAIFLRKQSLLPDDPDPYTPCWQVAGIDVIERFRRRGFGTKLYEEAARQAARHGMSLCSDTPDDVSNEALAFWEKQVAKGRAFWEVPGPADREGFNYDYGRFVLKRPISPSLSSRNRREAGMIAAGNKGEAMAKELYSIEFFTEHGEPDGYFARLTPAEAEDVRDRMKKAADMYELGDVRVFKVDLTETPNVKSLMETIEERYPS